MPLNSCACARNQKIAELLAIGEARPRTSWPGVRFKHSIAIACKPPDSGDLNIFANFLVLLSIRRQSIWLDFPIFP
jgi:hypothetical protein